MKAINGYNFAASKSIVPPLIAVAFVRITSNTNLVHIKEQERIGEALREDIDEAARESKKDLDFFVSTHEEAAESLQLSLDKSLLKAKKHETRNRPSQIVSKSITLLRDVDTNIFEKLTDAEKENLRGQLGRL